MAVFLESNPMTDFLYSEKMGRRLFFRLNKAAELTKKGLPVKTNPGITNDLANPELLVITEFDSILLHYVNVISIKRLCQIQKKEKTQ